MLVLLLLAAFRTGVRSDSFLGFAMPDRCPCGSAAFAEVLDHDYCWLIRASRSPIHVPNEYVLAVCARHGLEMARRELWVHLAPTHLEKPCSSLFLCLNLTRKPAKQSQCDG